MYLSQIFTEVSQNMYLGKKETAQKGVGIVTKGKRSKHVDISK